MIDSAIGILIGVGTGFLGIGWICLWDWLRERRAKKECCPTCEFYRGQDPYRCADCEDDAADGNEYPLWRRL